jgi:hypothetical protein
MRLNWKPKETTTEDLIATIARGRARQPEDFDAAKAEMNRRCGEGSWKPYAPPAYCKACGFTDCPKVVGEGAERPRCPADDPRGRCADCGEAGERTGHMGCQYPQDRG